MIKIYTAGYMTGPGVDRFDWRMALRDAIRVLRPAGDPIPIQWLHPGVPENDIPGQGNPDFYAPRDTLQVYKCDVLTAYFDLEQTAGQGTSFEEGLAYAWQKRIIMIDRSPDKHSLDFNRKMADSVWPTLEKAAEALLFIAEGFEQ